MRRLARIGLLLMLLGLACSARAPRDDAASPCAAPSFGVAGDLVEAPRAADSADACWWLSSGGRVTIADGVARTIHGELPPGAEWRTRYAESNPIDTDGGARPQNLLRLVTRTVCDDCRQRVRFRIVRVNPSASAERGEWSGVLLALRHLDPDNVYYAGLRMDGTAVIKKKRHGSYATLAHEPVFGEPTTWHRELNPSLLPEDRWITMAADIATMRGGDVRIELSLRDEHEASGWRVVARAVDDGRHGEPLRAPGHGGLRADFMDVEFADYALEPAARSR